jgi:hypothetical protein
LRRSIEKMNYEEISKEDLRVAHDNLLAVIEQLTTKLAAESIASSSSNCISKCSAEYDACVKAGTGLLVCSSNYRKCVSDCP